MSGKDTGITLVAGFVLTVAAAAALLLVPRFGEAHLVTGIVCGLGVAYLGFLLYYFLLPRPGEKGTGIPFLRGYLPGAALRYVIMIGAFCAVVFLLQVHAIGVLIGTFIGMMASTFVTLNKMRVPPPKSPEA
jgi:hypothetical protein